MDENFSELMPHKKRSTKKKVKKSDHKHIYKILEKQPLNILGWFNFKEVCEICGKVKNEFRIEK